MLGPRCLAASIGYQLDFYATSVILSQTAWPSMTHMHVTQTIWTRIGVTLTLLSWHAAASGWRLAPLAVAFLLLVRSRATKGGGF